MHVDRRGLRKERNSDEAEGKTFRENSVYLSNFYKKRRGESAKEISSAKQNK